MYTGFKKSVQHLLHGNLIRVLSNKFHFTSCYLIATLIFTAQCLLQKVQNWLVVLRICKQVITYKSLIFHLYLRVCECVCVTVHDCVETILVGLIGQVIMDHIGCSLSLPPSEHQTRKNLRVMERELQHGEGKELWAQITCVGALILPFTSCVTLGKLFFLF